MDARCSKSFTLAIKDWGYEDWGCFHYNAHGSGQHPAFPELHKTTECCLVWSSRYDWVIAPSKNEPLIRKCQAVGGAWCPNQFLT
jgi:hypothetical protein